MKSLKIIVGIFEQVSGLVETIKEVKEGNGAKHVGGNLISNKASKKLSKIFK
ncbi:hypothetical protein [Bacillus suaedae]|uniref:Uncharacterized protein n=1 Tax=Halalkalibacter suaedae TaxID=2822140 RepID=A0A941ANT8_9BACI|nr:hypothetical protein [Bacillus suaedae]MBP3951146.1 hypothetical protein [Bacillus suaedae]